MVEAAPNLILELLRAMRGEMAQILTAVGDLHHRMTSLELQMADLRKQVAHLLADFAGQSLRIDRIEGRLQRIERRLEIVPAG